MARNEEKHYGRLNRLLLMKEKEEYEKTHPKRPRLEVLETAEEIQKWLPSIKEDIDFYLKKSQVTCYSDQHVEECRLKIVKLEKEFKAFVRKLKQLTPGTLHSIPWTNRPYKRMKADVVNATPNKEFVPIPTPILEGEKPKEQQFHIQNLPSMDKPLYFVTNNTNVCKNVVETCKLSSVNCKNIVDDYELSSGNCSVVLDTCQPVESCKDIKNTSTLSSAASVNDSSEEIKTQEISVSNNCEKERCNKNSVESPCKQIPSLVDYDFLSDSEEDL